MRYQLIYSIFNIVEPMESGQFEVVISMLLLYLSFILNSVGLGESCELLCYYFDTVLEISSIS